MKNLITEHLDIWTSARKPKSNGGRGNSSTNGQTIYGIKKLRELILELAVRGKLVPQDPNDEPAGVLLEKVAKEKEKLIKEGKIKKEKSSPKIFENEKSFDTPYGWEWTRLGDVSDIIRGITFPSNEKSRENDRGRLACLRTTNVQDKIDWEDLLFIREKFVKREEQFIRENDIVMSMANSRELVGKVAIVDIKPNFLSCFGGFLGVIRPMLISPFYVMLLLRAQTNRIKLIDSASQTTNIANISLSKLKPLVLAVPPIVEQHRIVAKVDELMALCDKLEKQETENTETHQTLIKTLLSTLTTAADNKEFAETWNRIKEHFDILFTTEESIGQLKQTILQLAVMGKLVEQDPNDLPASELRKKIAKEKEMLIREGKIKKQKPLPVIKEDEKPFDLPEGWAWARPDDFSEKITDGEHFRPPTQNDGIYFLSAKDIRSEGVSLDEPLFISNETAQKALQRCNPKLGDILMVSRGATVGRTCIVDIEDTFCLLGSVILLKPLKSILSRYLNICLNSPYAFQKLVAASGSTAQPAIYLRDLKKIIFPIAPFSEQERIVNKVDEIMYICDSLKSKILKIKKIQVQLADTLSA